MSAKLVETITRRLMAVASDHDEHPEALMTAVTWMAVTLAKWLGMTPDSFLETFGSAFRGMYDGAVVLPEGMPATVFGADGGKS